MEDFQIIEEYVNTIESEHLSHEAIRALLEEVYELGMDKGFETGVAQAQEL